MFGCGSTLHDLSMTTLSIGSGSGVGSSSEPRRPARASGSAASTVPMPGRLVTVRAEVHYKTGRQPSASGSRSRIRGWGTRVRLVVTL